jgi:hypothetical protein
MDVSPSHAVDHTDQLWIKFVGGSRDPDLLRQLNDDRPQAVKNFLSHLRLLVMNHPYSVDVTDGELSYFDQIRFFGKFKKNMNAEDRKLYVQFINEVTLSQINSTVGAGSKKNYTFSREEQLNVITDSPQPIVPAINLNDHDQEEEKIDDVCSIHTLTSIGTNKTTSSKGTSSFSGSLSFFPTTVADEDDLPDQPDIGVPYRLSDVGVDYFARYGYTVKGGKKYTHDHPIAATERALAINFLLTYLSENKINNFVDVGSNLVKMTKNITRLGLARDLSVYGLMPNLISGDIMRIQDAQKLRMDNFCDHKLEECGCLRQGDYDCLTFIHSHYYLHPRSIAEAMQYVKTHNAYVVCHEFSNVCGELCLREGRYHIDLNGELVCEFSGNTPYRHNDMTWMQAGHAIFDDCTLEWTRIHRVGDTHVYKFTIGPIRKVPDPIDMSWKTAVNNDTGYADLTPLVGVLNSQLAIPSFETAVSKVNKIHFCFGRFYVQTDEQQIIVLPTGLMHALANITIGNERTKELYTTLVQKARGLCSNLKMPDKIMGPAIIYGAGIGMIYYCERETANLGIIAYHYEELFKQHKASLALQPLKPAWWFMRCLYYISPSCCCDNAHETPAARQWMNLRQQNVLADFKRTIQFKEPVKLPDVYEPKNRDPKKAKKAKLVKTYDPVMKEKKESTLTLHGIGFLQIQPTVIRRDAETAFNALANRITREIFDPDWDVWISLAARLDDRRSILNKFLVKLNGLSSDNRTPKPEILKAYFDRFPAKTALELRAAWNSLIDKPLTAHDCTQQAITKNEKSKPLVMGCDVLKATPRIVMNMTHRANAATGPYYYMYTYNVKKNFKFVGQWINVVWTPGHSNEELGDCTKMWVEALNSDPTDPMVCFYGDQDAMDLHNSGATAMFEEEIFVKSNMPDQFLLANFMTQTPKGRHQTYPGIRFKAARPTRISGKGNTSVGNFIVNVANMVHVLGEPGPRTWVGFFNGDDHWILMRQSFWNQIYKTIDSKMRACGFECTWKFANHLAKTEFCQMLPYPVGDSIIWGPKIGRVLYRIGYSTANSDLDVFGVAEGLRKTVSHIPFLREFLEVHRQLAKTAYGVVFPWTNLSKEEHEPTIETWNFIYDRYGVGQTEHNSFLTKLDEFRKSWFMPALIDWPTVLSFAKIDEELEFLNDLQ